jgi:HK97 family phage major capsid protein
MDDDDVTRAVMAELRRINSALQADFAKFSDAHKAKEGELQARLSAVEMIAARRGPTYGEVNGYSEIVGQVRALFEESADLKAVADRKSRRAVLEMPPGYFRGGITTPYAAITSTTGTGLSLPERLTEIVAPVQRRLTVRDLIPSIPVTAGSVQYTRETSFTNLAAPQSEGTLKAESAMVFSLQTTPIITVAHFVKTSLQVLSDTAGLMQHISSRLLFGLALAEENQLLKGSGVGNNLQGLYTGATSYNRTTSGDSKIDALRRAITQLQDTDYQPTGIVTHPFDWEAISLKKDSTGQYIAGSPVGTNRPQLWNLPVIATSAMTAGTFLVADFPQSALVFDREQDRLDVSTEDVDNFEKNMATIRAEARLGLALLRTGGLVKGTY